MLRELGEEIGRGPKCQNCGNQAKKGCEFMRCRTCCNNKGFRCQTHIKSTWVPACRRRHLQHHNPQTHTHNPSSELEELNKFPAAVSSMAVFRCVRVHSEDDSVDEYAYQTSVNIGGRVFSGVLYDQGPESFCTNVGESSKGPLIHPQHNHINTSMQTHDAVTVAPLMSPASAEQFSFSSYPLSLGAFRPGMPYFSQTKP